MRYGPQHPAARAEGRQWRDLVRGLILFCGPERAEELAVLCTELGTVSSQTALTWLASSYQEVTAYGRPAEVVARLALQLDIHREPERALEEPNNAGGPS